MPSSVENTAPIPAANVFLTSSGTRLSSRRRMVSGSSRSSPALSSPGLSSEEAIPVHTTGGGILSPMAEPAPAPHEEGGPKLPPVSHSQPLPRIRNPADSVHSLTAQRRGYRDDRVSRRPPLRIRSWRAYWTTWRVILSYLWLRLRARFHSEVWAEHKLRTIHLRNARRIERTIIELQGLFIKVGQLISIMTNFLPEEFRRELEGLQDSVPPRPYKDIEARLREEHGRAPEEVFAQFDPQPLASASIGQVHLARLPDGTKVAVKVQYPDIEIIVKRDLNT